MSHTKSQVLPAAGRLFTSAQQTEQSFQIEDAELCKVIGLFGYLRA